MRSAVLLVALAGSAFAGPVSRELLPPSSNASGVKLLAGADGFDVFWSELRSKTHPVSFELLHAVVGTDGVVRRAPEGVLLQAADAVATGDARTFGIAYRERREQNLAHVAVVAGDPLHVVWDAALPSHNRGFSALAIAWEPRSRRWLVAGEELVSANPQNDISVYARLFTTWLDERGTVEPLAYLTEPFENAHISDWGNDPLVRTRDGLALAWTVVGGSGGVKRTFISEFVAGKPPRHLQVLDLDVSSRTALAWTRSGYVLAGVDDARHVRAHRTWITTVRDGTVAPLRYISTPGASGGEVALASDGVRVAVAWHEDRFVFDSDDRDWRNVGSAVHVATLDEDGALKPVASSAERAGVHDWVWSAAWSAGRFAVAHSNGINPSGTQIVLVP